MVFSAPEHEVSHGSPLLENSESSTSNDLGFSFSDAFSREKSENEGAVGLPPLSSDSQVISSAKNDDLAPPLALENHQSTLVRSANDKAFGNSNDGERVGLNAPFEPNRTSLALEDAISPTNENSATAKVAFGNAINSRIEGVAKAIREAQLKATPVEIVEDHKPKSNKLAWQDNKTPIESLFSLRPQENSIPVPQELFSTSQKPIEKPDSKIKASIGLEEASVSEVVEKESDGKGDFHKLTGSPSQFLNSHKIEQAKRFNGAEARHTKTINGERTGTSTTAKDFSSLETYYGLDGQVSTSEYDSYRRPVSKLEESYSDSGEHEFELTQFNYGEGNKVKPFADFTRVIKYRDNKAQVELFDNRGIKPQLISENSWS